MHNFCSTFMSMLYVRESGNCCQSLSVRRPLHKPGFYFVFELLFFFFFFNFNIDVKFYPTDWELMGYRTRIGNKKKKRRSFLWSNTVPYLSCQSQIPLRCLIVMVLPISGLMAWNVWNTKTSWVWSSGQSKKKKGLKWCHGDRQIMKRDCISLKMSVFFFGTLPLQLITCIKMYRWWNLLLNVREIIKILRKRW